MLLYYVILSAFCHVPAYVKGTLHKLQKTNIQESWHLNIVSNIKLTEILTLGMSMIYILYITTIIVYSRSCNIAPLP